MANRNPYLNSTKDPFKGNRKALAESFKRTGMEIPEIKEAFDRLDRLIAEDHPQYKNHIERNRFMRFGEDRDCEVEAEPQGPSFAEKCWNSGMAETAKAGTKALKFFKGLADRMVEKEIT